MTGQDEFPIKTEAWPQLGSNDLHVWHLDLDRRNPLLQMHDHGNVLSEPEIARCAQFVDPTARSLYRLAHGGLRQILSGYLNQDPATLSFRTTENGKPVLLHNSPGPALSFNLSHSGRRAAIAISPVAPVGVDIEQIRDCPNYIAIARRFFAVEELDFLISQPVHDQITIFFRIWTLKEAFIKLTGKALAQPLNSFAILPTSPPCLLHSDSETGAGCWSYHCMAIDHYFCSVISADGLARIRHFSL